MKNLCKNDEEEEAVCEDEEFMGFSWKKKQQMMKNEAVCENGGF